MYPYRNNYSTELSIDLKFKAYIYELNDDESISNTDLSLKHNLVDEE